MFLRLLQPVVPVPGLKHTLFFLIGGQALAVCSRGGNVLKMERTVSTVIPTTHPGDLQVDQRDTLFISRT